MATIYVVTTGCYSDYSINGIFSTKKLAAKYIKEYNECHELNSFNDIEEWILDDDEQTKAIKRPFWIVTIDLISGDINNYDVNHHEYTHEEYPFSTPVEELIKYNIASVVFKVKSYKSLDHAQKLAAEYRQELLRIHPQETWVLVGYGGSYTYILG